MQGSGRQSAFSIFGADAGTILAMTGWMTLAGMVVAIVVTALFVIAIRSRRGSIGLAGGERLVLWAGAIVPSLLLGILLFASLPAMKPLPVAAGDMVVRVTGEQFWWRVAYRPAGSAAPIVAANEIRLPVGRTVALDLDAGDVIHSFWVPGLAGKMDMIPGRTNRLVVRADKAGRYRGQCAEFCGLSHALMAFDVVAMPAADFDRWLATQGSRAIANAGPGAQLFAQNGCGGCHAIRGTAAAGVIGPDLTHIGARATIGAGIRRNTPEELVRFIRAASSVKPGARMPAYPQLSDADARAIATYLEHLR